jgi:hypothetical protein
LIRALKIVPAAMLLSVPFALATAASAQTCAAPDLTCTVDHVIDDGQDGTGAADDPVGDGVGNAVDDVGGTAQGAVDDVQQTVDHTAGTVHETLDDVLGSGGIDPPGGGGGGNGGGGDGHHTGKGGTGHGNVGNGGGRAHTRSGTAGAGVHASVATGTEPLTPTTGEAGTTDRGALPPTVGQVAARVIGGIAVMALLLGAVAAFLSLQDRLDRGDPKLVPAAIGSDRVRFT